MFSRRRYIKNGRVEQRCGCVSFSIRRQPPDGGALRPGVRGQTLVGALRVEGFGIKGAPYPFQVARVLRVPGIGKGFEELRGATPSPTSTPAATICIPTMTSTVTDVI